MLARHPLELPPGRKLSREEITDALRLSIIAELDAINLYLQLARAIDDVKIRKIFEDIAREEKTHVGEFLTLLKQMDPEQVEELRKGEEEVLELAGSRKENHETSTSSNVLIPEEVVPREVKKLVDSARLLTKKISVLKIGRGADSIPLERSGEKIERFILPLCELSYRFRVTQRALDYAVKTGQLVEMPEATRASLALASEEDRYVVETLIKEAGVKTPLGSWEEPGASVIDIANAVNELSKRAFRRPFILIINPSRYTKLLAVSEKTGVTDLERVKMLVDEVISIHHVPDDKAIVFSANLEVLDLVYGGFSEVDYIGPEDGYHTFRLWSSVVVRVKNPEGIVLLEAGIK